MRAAGAIKSVFRAAASSVGPDGRNGSRDGHHKPYRYSAFDLLRHGFPQADWPRAWRKHDVRPSYDVVIVGGGVHGLATASYLAANADLQRDLQQLLLIHGPRHPDVDENGEVVELF